MQPRFRILWKECEKKTLDSLDSITCFQFVVAMVRNEMLLLLISTRSSHQRCSLRKGIIITFRKFHRKTPGTEGCNFIKKRPNRRCSPVKFAKFLRTVVLKNICGWLLLSHWILEIIIISWKMEVKKRSLVAALKAKNCCSPLISLTLGKFISECFHTDNFLNPTIKEWFSFSSNHCHIKCNKNNFKASRRRYQNVMYKFIKKLKRIQGN